MENNANSKKSSGTDNLINYNKLNGENKGEQQYLEIIKDVIENGELRENRTNIKTLSKFGGMMKFNLNEGFPLLTTKKMHWKAIVEELLWFIKGDTNSKHLSEKGIKIWDANGSREFLDSRGLTERAEGDLGPIYGFQWRHFGAHYYTSEENYNNQGIDQLAECIELIKNDPYSRRIIMTSWNPNDLNEMALPPCHVMCQFNVSTSAKILSKKLNCLVFQRSCDLGLGVPFNIASYALLTHIIAHVCNIEVGELIYMMGDYHIYVNHIEGLKEQSVRPPFPFATLKIKCDIKEIEDYKFEDFELFDYNSHSLIKMEMVI